MGTFPRTFKTVRVVLQGRGNTAAAAQTVLTRFLSLALNASTSIVVARLLKAQGRGEMAALIMWSGLLTGIVTFGLPSSLVFNLRRRPERASSVVATSFLLSLFIAVVIGFIGYAILPFALRHYSAVDIREARWFLLTSPIPIVTLVVRAALEAEGKFSHSNVMMWSGALVTLVALIGLGGSHRLTPVTGGLAYVLGTLPALVWLFTRVWHDYLPALRGVRRASSDLLTYGVRSWGIDLLSALAGQADQVLIVRFLNSEMMGTYIVAANFARLLSVFQTSATAILFPRVAACEPHEVVSLTGKTARVTTICAAIGAVLAALTGSTLLRIIYGAEYARNGTAVFKVLLCEVVISGVTEVLAQAFMALGRPGVVSAVQAAGVTIGLSLMPILIGRFGIIGAGIALLLSTTVRFLLTLLCFRPILHMNPPNLLMDRSDWSFAASRLSGFAAPSEVAAE